MSHIYIAGRFSRRFEFQGYRADVQRAGFTVVSRWIDLAKENEANAARCAMDDLEDLRLSDTVIVFGDEPRSTRSRGGRHVEFGYALALGKRMILVGHRENIFASLPAIEFFETWPQALAALTTPQQRLAA
jgi:nucleoside 2-deoxyribosyltransferase